MTHRLSANKLQKREVPAHQLSLGCELSERLLASRGIHHADELDVSLARLLPPLQLKGMAAACECLGRHLQQRSEIIVVGDFDADGATSTALLIRGLRGFGHANIDYLLPDRQAHGYGLSPELLLQALEGRPQLIITVDNGIASLSGVETARELGIEVLVTDHHLPGDELPKAAAILNPNAQNDPPEARGLAGVGVVFYLLMGLRGWLREQGWFATRAEPNLAQWLDLVALGTVADLVPLNRLNRTLVSQGLQRMRSARGCAGIRALFEIARRNLARASAQDLGFAIGPRLNAAGRLDDMSIGVECLLAETDHSARELASFLDEINASRQQLQQQMQQQAQALPVLQQDHRYGAVLYQADWHEGVVGLIASRIKDQIHAPVVAFAQSQHGMLKGSARSIKGIHIRDLLDRIDRKLPGAILRFGGHAMAAGLTLKLDALQAFEECFIDELKQQDEECFEQCIRHDGELQSLQHTLDMAQKLIDLGPWGQKFPEPLFVGRFQVRDWQVLKQAHLKLELQQGEQGNPVSAIAFYVPEEILTQPQAELHCSYRLQINEYRQRQSLQLLIEHFLD